MHPKVTYDLWLVSDAIESNSLMNLSPFQIVLYVYGMWKNGFQTLPSEPLTAFIPSKTACQEQIILPVWDIYQAHPFLPVRTGAQWPRDG